MMEKDCEGATDGKRWEQEEGNDARENKDVIDEEKDKRR